MILLLLLLLRLALLLPMPRAERVCKGTLDRSADNDDSHQRYLELRQRYANCTLVDGNLEIVRFLEHQDFGFLDRVREITGYLLIKQVNAPRIALPALRIVRGRTTFLGEFGVFVSQTKLRRLELPGLVDIVNGSVGLHDNPHLCNLASVNWNELISSNSHGFYQENGLSPKNCTQCDPDCDEGCWGDGPGDCQRFSRVVCSGQCWQGRCFGPDPRDCCHPWCAGGCIGPSQTDCLACKYFEDDGVCVLECPRRVKVYNPKTRSWKSGRKYVHGLKCVSECPEGTLVDDSSCVSSCPMHKKVENGKCVSCEEGECPKTCKGDWVVHSGNVESFRGCTKIEGDVNIWDVSFQGFQDVNFDRSLGPVYEPMSPGRLEVFRSVREITGFLHVRASHQEFRDLICFRNLEVIGGLAIFQTSLVSLGLNSLREVNADSVKIVENKDLCYADSVNWRRVKKSAEAECLLLYNKKKADCIREGLVCDEQCSGEGCWGPSANQCLSCKNFVYKNHCVESCHPYAGYYENSNNRSCEPCPDEDVDCDDPPCARLPLDCNTYRSVSLL